LVDGFKLNFDLFVAKLMHVYCKEKAFPKDKA